MRGRRGQMQRLYLILFEIFIVVMLAFVVIKKVSTVNADYQKRFLSKDIALLLDASYASPAAFEYEYGFPGLSKQTVALDKQYVDVTGRRHPFAQDLTIRSDFALPSADTFRFKREPGLLDLAHVRFVPEKLVCPAVRAVAGRIVIDAAHGYDAAGAKQEREKLPDITDAELAVKYGEPGNTGKDTEGKPVLESELTYRLAAALETAIKGRLSGKETFLTRKGPQQALTIAQRTQAIGTSASQAILSLHVGAAAKPKELPLIIYVNGRGSKLAESVAIACQVLNALAEKYPLSLAGAQARTGVIPVDTRLLPENDPLRVLPDSMPGVALELGNINNPDDPLLKDTGTLVTTISSGLQAAIGGSS